MRSHRNLLPLSNWRISPNEVNICCFLKIYKSLPKNCIESACFFVFHPPSFSLKRFDLEQTKSRIIQSCSDSSLHSAKNWKQSLHQKEGMLFYQKFCSRPNLNFLDWDLYQQIYPRTHMINQWWGSMISSEFQTYNWRIRLLKYTAIQYQWFCCLKGLFFWDGQIWVFMNWEILGCLLFLGCFLNWFFIAFMANFKRVSLRFIWWVYC